VKPAADLSKNWHDLYVTETGAGGTSAESKHIQFQFDNTVPNKPAITGLTGDNGLPIIGGTTENPHPSLSGAGATPGDTITLYDGKLAIGSTQVGADGKWTVKPGKDLSVGEHDVYVIETSRAGVPGAESDHVVFSVTSNTGPLPAAPEITDLIAATGPHAGSIASGQISTDGQPTVKGTGHAGDQINVFDGAKLLGTTIVNAEGKWSFKPADELRDGAHKLHVSATHDGVTSAPSADYLVSVTYILISGVYDLNSMPIENGGTADGALTIKGWLDRSVITHGFDLYMSGGNASVPQKMTGASITVTGDTFTIQVSKDTASSYGAWHPASGTFVFSFMADSTAGRIDTSLDKNLTYTVTDDFNASPALVKSVSAPDAVAHDHQAVVTEPTILKAASVVADATPAAPAAVVPVINAAHDTGAETYVVSGTGHAGDVIRLFDGAVYIGAGFVDSTGHWSIEPSTQLDYGTHGLTATANSAGVISAASASFGLTIGGVEPNPQPVMFDLPAPDLHTVELNGNAAAYFQQASVHLQGGTDGVNALHLTGDHQVLDLTSLTGMTAAAKVSGFQVMDLGGHANTLKLSLVDVLNLGEQNLFQYDDTKQMMVKGSNGDSVDLSTAHVARLADGVWEHEGTTQVGGVIYNVYEHANASVELLVQQGVHVVVH
jgi:large repetitive protein